MKKIVENIIYRNEPTNEQTHSNNIINNNNNDKPKWDYGWKQNNEEAVCLVIYLLFVFIRLSTSVRRSFSPNVFLYESLPVCLYFCLAVFLPDCAWFL